jgi:Ca2+-binding RTX toxin-like protein
MPGIDIYGTEADDVIAALFPDDSIWDLEGNDMLTGGAGANFLVGGEGNDRLDGAAGDDLLMGDQGDDVLFGGAGNDYLLGGGGGSDRLFGGDGDDRLDGDFGPNVLLDGGAGSDTALYHLTSFAIAIDLAAGTITGGVVLVGIENAVGGYGDDRITGDAGGNVLDGWIGRDVLTGGGGADRFLVSAAGHSGPGAADRITDFSHGDRIDLSAIDADPGLAGDQAFVFIGGGAFTGTAGQLRAVVTGGDTVVSGDLDGDRAADVQIVLTGAVALTATDFAL